MGDYFSGECSKGQSPATTRRWSGVPTTRIVAVLSMTAAGSVPIARQARCRTQSAAPGAKAPSPCMPPPMPLPPPLLARPLPPPLPLITLLLDHALLFHIIIIICLFLMSNLIRLMIFSLVRSCKFTP